MPASCARRRTASKSSSGKRRFTDLSLRFISKRIIWPTERSYSVRSAVATKSSASLSVLNVGIAFFIALHLFLVHVTSADGADQHAVTAFTQRKDHEYLTTIGGGANRSKPLFALAILLIGQHDDRLAEDAFDRGDRQPVFLALLAVAAVPIEAIELHAAPLG